MFYGENLLIRFSNELDGNDRYLKNALLEIEVYVSCIRST